MRQTGAKLSDDKYKAWVNNGIKYGSLAPRFSNLPDEQLSGLETEYPPSY